MSELRRLSDAEIDAAIGPGHMGIYALGSLNADGTFSIAYIGRAEIDLAEKLRAHIGDSYRAFSFALAATALSAYRMECELFHHIRPSDNHTHPVRPAGTRWTCPVCGR
jgi:hypothetical protein